MNVQNSNFSQPLDQICLHLSQASFILIQKRILCSEIVLCTAILTGYNLQAESSPPLRETCKHYFVSRLFDLKGSLSFYGKNQADSGR